LEETNYSTCAEPSEPVTLESITEAVRKFREEHPFAGFQQVENKWIPEGMEFFRRDDQFIIADKANLRLSVGTFLNPFRPFSK
jgi:hypothetical protein